MRGEIALFGVVAHFGGKDAPILIKALGDRTHDEWLCRDEFHMEAFPDLERFESGLGRVCREARELTIVDADRLVRMGAGDHGEKSEQCDGGTHDSEFEFQFWIWQK